MLHGTIHGSVCSRDSSLARGTLTAHCSLCRGMCIRALSCYFCLAGDDTVTMRGPCMHSLLPWEVYRDQPIRGQGCSHLTNERRGGATDTGSVVSTVNIVITPRTSISAQCQLSHLRPSQPGLWLVNVACIWALNGWWYLTIPSANTRTKCRSDTALC